MKISDLYSQTPYMAHWYRCKNCGTVMHTPFRAPRGSPYACIGGGQGACRTFMTYIGYDTCPASQHGKVTWNPSAQLERKKEPQ
jgi:hypothetical protein